MKRTDIIPYPNKITYLGSTVDIDKLSLTDDCIRIDRALGEEEYKLKVTADGIEITAGSDKGVFYAKQTLKQLHGQVECILIEDAPAFSYRGFMVDTVRHIVSLEDTKKLIDAAAASKMNVMHWHLTDDQGWRIYIDGRPEICEKGSVRKSSDFGEVHINEPYGGYFTVAQLKEIVAYCAERYITVIPEIDLPGHTSALLHVYPQLSCTGKQIDVKTKQGIFPDILCAGKDETFDIVFDILEKVLDIFPSETIHIGGDEAPKKRWKACPDCQKRILSEGLKNEEELQGWFVNRIVDFLAQRGRKAVVWNESLKSGLVRNSVTVQQWMDRKKHSVHYANRGGKIIVSDFFHYYVDYPYGMTPLKKTYKFSPFIKGLSAKGKNNVIGVETPLWTEYVDSFDRFCYQGFPRFTAVAETGWTKPENKDYEDFRRRFEIFAYTLRGMGIYPAPKVDWDLDPLVRIGKTIGFFKGII